MSDAIKRLRRRLALSNTMNDVERAQLTLETDLVADEIDNLKTLCQRHLGEKQALEAELNAIREGVIVRDFDISGYSLAECIDDALKIARASVDACYASRFFKASDAKNGEAE